MAPTRPRNMAVAISVSACAMMLITLFLPRFQLDILSITEISYPYLLIELFTVIISVLVVATSYHSLARQPYVAQANLLIFGFFIVAFCDLAHALTFPGQAGFVAAGGAMRTIYFRLMGRSAESFTLIAIAGHLVLHGSRYRWLLAAVAVSCLFGWLNIYHLDWLPSVLSDNSTSATTTPFKTGYEYTLAAVNFCTALAFWRQADTDTKQHYYLFASACTVMAAGNVVFAQYRTPFDFTFTFAQIFKVIAYALIYRATFVAAIKTPYDLLQKSEQLLRDSQQQLKALSDNLPDGMVYQMVSGVDNERHFVFVSAGIERLSAHTLSTQRLLADASQFYSRLLAEDAAQLQAAERHSAQHMGVLTQLVRLKIPNNQVRHLLMRAQPRIVTEGQIIWDGVAIDVTERELIAAELRKLNSELEYRVSARTAALTHANKRLEAFSYMVAHDLRAPLRNISGYTALLKEAYGSRIDEDGRHLLDSIADSRDSMAALIDGILAIATLERAVPRRTTVDLSELATDIATDLLHNEPQRSVRFVIQPGLNAEVDPALMKNVLQNLIHNAWKFTAERSPAVIEFGASHIKGKQIYFVRDNGIGFASTDAEQLFDMFWRLPTHSGVAGHGIGLASVKSIITNHGGALWAEGEPGKGAVFYFDLSPASEPSFSGTLERRAVSSEPPFTSHTVQG